MTWPSSHGLSGKSPTKTTMETCGAVSSNGPAKKADPGAFSAESWLSRTTCVTLTKETAQVAHLGIRESPRNLRQLVTFPRWYTRYSSNGSTEVQNTEQIFCLGGLDAAGSGSGGLCLVGGGLVGQIWNRTRCCSLRQAGERGVGRVSAPIGVARAARL